MKVNRFSTLLGQSAVTAVMTIGLVSMVSTTPAHSQAPAATTAAPATRQMGTVKAITGSSITIATDAGQQYAVAVADGARIVQLAPGSTDLKAAQTIALTDIGVGDRILVTGKPGDAADSFSANRVILMKSGDIAQKHATEQADWQKHGLGGLVSTVDASSGTVTISSGAKKIQVQTTPQTTFRRYAGDSVKFEDAKPGTMAQIQTGDQLEVRGAKSDDGTSIKAEEVVSGAFRNLSGTLASVNAAGGTITLKDLTTKKLMTVTVTANSDLRKLPPEVATRFAARQRGAAAGGAGATPAARPASATGGDHPAGEAGAGGGRSAGLDLSKMLARLPSQTIGDLHVGDAVMIVASQSPSGADMVTAVTLLSGVDAILAATPSGTQTMTLSPWNVGGGAPEGGGGQ
jgi:hypothetical protein